MRTSSIGEAQDALETILKARNIVNARGHKVPIDLGWPKGGPQPEHIWIGGDVDDWRQVQSVTGDMEEADREETYVLKVRILVAKRDSYRTARNRLLALVAEVELALREYFTLAGAVWEGELAGGSFGEEVNDEGHAVAATLRLSMTAFLGAG